MNRETALLLLELGRFALDALGHLERGEMTDDEVMAEWQKLNARLAASNAMWERATRG